MACAVGVANGLLDLVRAGTSGVLALEYSQILAMDEAAAYERLSRRWADCSGLGVSEGQTNAGTSR
ncbi:hypothetical protein [Nocardia altamirensis]|uniref:hypothetical protein n=1 Tax=Nocardia altamirensis TaxID=472158 RepID=UPI00114CB8AF|nr:hypothetical protein [Nocardia altamirensis]